MGRSHKLVEPAADRAALWDIAAGRVEKLLYTLEDVAYLLSLSKREVESLVQLGFIESAIAPGTKRARRISREQLRRYILRHEAPLTK